MYVTHVHTNINDADTFFPHYDKKMWIETKNDPFLPDEKHSLPYTIKVYDRRM